MFQSQKDSVKERLNKLSLGNMFQAKLTPVVKIEEPVEIEVKEIEVKKVEKSVNSNQVKSSTRNKVNTLAKK